jgi:hypothetical protein
MQGFLSIPIRGCLGAWHEAVDRLLQSQSTFEIAFENRGPSHSERSCEGACHGDFRLRSESSISNSISGHTTQQHHTSFVS